MRRNSGLGELSFIKDIVSRDEYWTCGDETCKPSERRSSLKLCIRGSESHAIEVVRLK